MPFPVTIGQGVITVYHAATDPATEISAYTIRHHHKQTLGARSDRMVGSGFNKQGRSGYTGADSLNTIIHVVDY